MIEIGCPQCGYATELQQMPEDSPDYLQCPMCGTWIRADGEKDPAATELLPDSDDLGETSPLNTAEVGHLLVSGSLTPEEPHALRAPKTVVGREGADVTVEDPTMSIRHFEIETREGEYFIRDLGSTNGTRVNGERIQTAQLKSGDRIQAGLTCFVFQTLQTVAWDQSD